MSVSTLLKPNELHVFAKEGTFNCINAQDIEINAVDGSVLRTKDNIVVPLGIGSANQVLSVNATADDVEWKNASGGVEDPLILSNDIDYSNKFNVRDTESDIVLNVDTHSKVTQIQELLVDVPSTSDILILQANDADIDGIGNPGALYIEPQGFTSTIVNTPGDQTFAGFQTWLKTSIESAVPGATVEFEFGLGVRVNGISLVTIETVTYPFSFILNETATKSSGIQIYSSLDEMRTQANFNYRLGETLTIMAPTPEPGYGQLMLTSNTVSNSNGSQIYLDDGLISLNRPTFLAAGLISQGPTKLCLNPENSFIIVADDRQPLYVDYYGCNISILFSDFATIHNELNIAGKQRTADTAASVGDMFYNGALRLQTVVKPSTPSFLSNDNTGNVQWLDIANLKSGKQISADMFAGTLPTNSSSGAVATSFYPYNYTGATAVDLSYGDPAEFDVGLNNNQIRYTGTGTKILRITYSACINPSQNDKNIMFGIVKTLLIPTVYPNPESTPPTGGSAACFTLKDGGSNSSSFSHTFITSVDAGQYIYPVFSVGGNGETFNIDSYLLRVENV